MYSYPLFRPPSEARSLIIQITEGCSHNKCKFCYMYKNKQFRMKKKEEILKHIDDLKAYYPNPEKIFLADGNVLCLKTDMILDVLELVKKVFPTVKRISSYSGPLDLLRKTDDELKSIKDAGLDLLYMGVESGSDKVLEFMDKGVTASEMIEAGQKARKAGFAFSCMIISGLGGKELMNEHAIESAKVISAIDPEYFALLTLMVEEGTMLQKEINEDNLRLLNPDEVVEETMLILENLDLTNCMFRSNHVSNYVNLAGILNRDKNDLVEKLKRVKDRKMYNPEFTRQL